MSSSPQLRIAARIRFLLKQALGESIDVTAMLSNPRAAQEILFVCQASGDAELASLARQFVTAGQLAPTRSDAPQEAAWAQNTSGFGISQPPPVLLESEPSRRAGVSGPRWWRRSPERVAR